MPLCFKLRQFAFLLGCEEAGHLVFICFVHGGFPVAVFFYRNILVPVQFNQLPALCLTKGFYLGFLGIGKVELPAHFNTMMVFV